MLAFLTVTAFLAAPFLVGYLLYRRWHRSHAPRVLSEHEAQRVLYPAHHPRVEYRVPVGSRNGTEGD